MAFPSNMSSNEAIGAASRAFKVLISLAALLYITSKKPPPIPMLWKQQTPSQSNVAMAASATDPPFRNISLNMKSVEIIMKGLNLALKLIS